MIAYTKQVEVRWSDLDPNFHLRHSVYYDWGAFIRMCFLTEYGLTTTLLQQLHFGPILFREECVFKREVLFGDTITIHLAVTKSLRDYSRWTMVHEIWKNGTTLCAIITIDGAWLDTKLRKLAMPPPQIAGCFEAMPKNEHFEWTD